MELRTNPCLEIAAGVLRPPGSILKWVFHIAVAMPSAFRNEDYILEKRPIVFLNKQTEQN